MGHRLALARHPKCTGLVTCMKQCLVVYVYDKNVSTNIYLYACTTGSTMQQTSSSILAIYALKVMSNAKEKQARLCRCDWNTHQACVFWCVYNILSELYFAILM